MRGFGCGRPSVRGGVASLSEPTNQGSAEHSTSTISASRRGGTWAKKYQMSENIPSEPTNPWSKEPAGRFGHFTGRFAKYHICENDLPEITAKRTGSRTKNYEQTTNDSLTTDITHWDIAPPQEYFDELFRVSKNQIIWGGNYFSLPPTRCFLIWRKLTISESFSMAMCEYAWTSFNDNAKLFEFAPQGNANNKRFHPTQKPVALYEWILSRYAKDGDIILDTHCGSASSLIACHRTNHKFVGFELDEYYYKLSKQRLDDEMAQMTIYDFLG